MVGVPPAKRKEEGHGSYFGILLVPYVDILLYNEEEEEFKQQDTPDPLETLQVYSHSYGEPFSSIAEALKKGG